MNKEELVIEFSKWIDQQSDNANFTVFNGVEWMTMTADLCSATSADTINNRCSANSIE